MVLRDSKGTVLRQRRALTLYYSISKTNNVIWEKFVFKSGRKCAIRESCYVKKSVWIPKSVENIYHQRINTPYYILPAFGCYARLQFRDQPLHWIEELQLNLHETDILCRYLSHHLIWQCSSISEDLQEICSICSQNCFCYCFWTILLLSIDGLMIEYMDQSHIHLAVQHAAISSYFKFLFSQKSMQML